MGSFLEPAVHALPRFSLRSVKSVIIIQPRVMQAVNIQTAVSTAAVRRFSRPLRTPCYARAATRAAKSSTTLPNGVNSAYSLAKYAANATKGRILFHGVHHVALLCQDLERSLDFYCGLLGLEVNPDRPDDKLPYRGAWLWIGPEMIHLMELPNPDPADGRPEHGGRDRHFCVGVESIEPLVGRLEEAKVPFTRSMSGRAAVFFRDPDMNCLEVVEAEAWR